MAKVIGPRLKSGKNKEYGFTVVNTDEGCYIRQNRDFKPGPGHAKFLAGGERMRLATSVASPVNRVVDIYLRDKKAKKFFRILVSRSCMRGANDRMSVLKVFVGNDARDDLKFDEYVPALKASVSRQEGVLQATLSLSQHPQPVQGKSRYQVSPIVLWWRTDKYVGHDKQDSQQFDMTGPVPQEMNFKFKGRQEADDYLVLLSCAYSTHENEQQNERETVLKIVEAGSLND